MIVSEAGQQHAFSWVPGLLAVLKRRRYVLALPVLAGLAIGLAGYASTPFSYVSEAVVALDVRRVQAFPTETVVSPLPQDSPVLRTEIDVISSRLMAKKVIERLERNGVVIAPEEPERTFLTLAQESTAKWLEASAEPGEEEVKAGQAEPVDERKKIDRLLSDLGVSNDGRSYTIFLSFRSSDPEFAANVANAYASSYLDHQIEVQRSATRRVSDWLGETLVNLRSDLETAERAAGDFRQEAGLVETNGATLQAQRVTALNAELVVARSALASANARLETVRTLAEDGDIPSLAEILSSETIQALRADQARLERKRQELQDRGAIKSAQIAMLDTELASLKAQIAREVDRIVESLSNEIAIAARKQESLESALRRAQTELSKANQAEVTMAQLEREANANRTIYESYLVRYKQTIEQDGIAAPEAQIISMAEPASARASPRLATWVLFGLGIGGSAAVAGAVLREATDRRPRLPELLRGATGIPVVGVLPRLTRAEQRRADEDARHAETRFGRALSMLRMILRIAANRKPSVAMALTSTFEGEGKTTLALGMARSAAAAGISTVVVDANLRNPSVERAFDVEVAAYIDELVSQHRSVDELVQDDPGSGLKFIAARAGVIAPEQLFASTRFAALVAELKSRFDLVLIDTPNLDVAPDALEIASAADRVLFVMRFDVKRLQQAIASVGSLASCGRPPDGIVLNKVDRRSYAALSKRSFQAAIPPAAARASADQAAAQAD